MKVCSVCNEIVSANQSCNRSDCPFKSVTTAAPNLSVKPGLTGKADKAVQTGLDFASDAARRSTRQVMLAITAAAFIGGASYLLYRSLGNPSSNASETMNAASNQQSGSTGQPTDLRVMSCDNLWNARNRIYAEAGKCFKTEKAIATFGARCYPPYGELSREEKARVSEIMYWEEQKGCQ
jgi:hypothetical protein